MSENLTDSDLELIEARAKQQAQYVSAIDSTHVSMPLRDVLALVDALRAAWTRLQECEQETDRMVLDRLRAADRALGFDKWDWPDGDSVSADAEPGGA